MMMTIEEYKAQFDHLSERERAGIEAELYDRLRVPGWRAPSKKDGRRGGTGIGDWFGCLHGIPGASRRSSVHIMGVHARMLWDRLENGQLTLYTAARIAVFARRREGDPGVAILDEIEAYERGERGDLKRPPDSRPTMPSPPSDVNCVVVPFTFSPDIEVESSDPQRVFWAKIRSQILTHFKAQQDLPETESLAAELNRELNSTFDLFLKKLRKLRAGKETRIISIGELSRACLVLNHDEPVPGEDLDAWLKLASRRKKSLARSYHPDSNGGNKAMQTEYQAVIDAYLVCDMYVTQKEDNPADRGVAKRKAK